MTPPYWKQPLWSPVAVGTQVEAGIRGFRIQGIELPLLSTLWEKSPCLSRAVGTRLSRSLTGSVRRWNSWLQKKKSFLLSALNFPGM